MNIAMSMKFPKGTKFGSGSCTEFQMHKSQQTVFGGIMNRIIDYTEHRLIRHIKNIEDAQQKSVLVTLLSDYISGKVAIAWKRGNPVWINVSKA